MLHASHSLQTPEAPYRMMQNGHGHGMVPAAAAATAAAVARPLPEICFILRRKVLAFLEQNPCALSSDGHGAIRSVQMQTRASIEVVQEALRRYGPAELSLSYNGGKDCLVLLVLILASLPAIYDPQTSSSLPSPTSSSNSSPTNGPDVDLPTLQAIYIAPPDPFPEVEEFVTRTTKEYQLDLARYALPMRRALEAYRDDKPSVKAIFMGTRRTDPHCEFLTPFAQTDKGWPQFMRVNPILDWHYVDIWTFIRCLDVPFCSLYQQGYSSLGGVTNTRPNPALAIDAQGTEFRPAYELVRDDEERLGRDR
ncbi:hypothetical protein E4U30_000465 [Claviceps sp. LM220 group G6]|nr:hypothetical protein E4U30_000465 [Claviceps sp. LM220 group G6]KAG6109128.1 hypothetical protein E4U31_007094 [Claviceps sp. LM219 group G6]KAG6122887.1 hypothetical protein E4U14_003761 [Claviceps sp. LM454 group G7]